MLQNPINIKKIPLIFGAAFLAVLLSCSGGDVFGRGSNNYRPQTTQPSPDVSNQAKPGPPQKQQGSSTTPPYFLERLGIDKPVTTVWKWGFEKLHQGLKNLEKALPAVLNSLPHLVVGGVLGRFYGSRKGKDKVHCFFVGAAAAALLQLGVEILSPGFLEGLRMNKPLVNHLVDPILGVGVVALMYATIFSSKMVGILTWGCRRCAGGLWNFSVELANKISSSK